MKEVRLSIKITSGDMHHFLVQQNYRSFSGLFGVFCSTIATVYLLFTFQSNPTSSNVILALIGALFLVVQPIQLKLSSVQKVQLVPMFQEPLLYTLNDEGIKIQQKEEEAQITWDDVSKVKESGKSIFVYTSPLSAFIFPKNQYDNQVEEVKQIIKEHVKEEKCKWK
ncbi:YcxB family protein [[Clostridium] polysaccharolyticum]|uniref:YcxB-like protein n=1 Tax=[Clostridium] polysaccharolyticum TaxID=29364 RepID=A0A1I0FCJ8_9FIRM|nr:YcxB family protein [[Clostridium] polysaccharolyticum]SET55874.1 YcxB-like protein [[Clostridium] polysaccharolyticum]